MSSMQQLCPPPATGAAGQGLRIALGQATDRGRKPSNQDFHAASHPGQPQGSLKGMVVALADGISSSTVSHIAAQTAVTGFIADYYSTPDAWSVRKSAQRVLAATNAWLYSQTRRSEYRYDSDRGYVCTFSALILKAATAHLLHVGDSRIYRLRQGVLEQMTRDHRVWVGSHEHFLERALGVSQYLQIDYQSLGLQRGDLFILATDGVYEFIQPARLCELIREHGDDLDRAAGAIVEHALGHGSDDNLTIQLVRVDDLPPASALEFSSQASELAPAPLLASREQFDGFTVQRELHASSRSHVYLATDNDTGETLVLKVPSLDLRDDLAYLERLMLEEWVARRINHPNVLKAPPQHRPRHYLYTVSEYVQGQTLQQWMRDHPRPDLQTVRDIIGQIARGLQALHRLDMLHQDLRPQNILIDALGNVTLIDFGSVAVAGLAELKPATGVDPILGTCQYTAPEYFAGRSGTQASDIFSLAVITYQMLTGQLPYGTEVAKATSRAAQLKLRYRGLGHYRQDLPPWLDEVLRRALQPDPARRCQELSEFTHDLSQPGLAREGMHRPALLERNPVLVWQGISLLLGVLLVLSWWRNPG